jgi:thiamine-triphosphatase
LEALQATQELLLGGSPPYPISGSSTTQATATKGLLARDLYEIPPPPVAIPGLHTFARIVTHRSSWSLPRDDDGDVAGAVVVVDLDTTDFGYAVGEVERLVTKASDIEAARRDLQTWLETVLGKDALAGPPPVGKLEYYLQTQQPHVYNILVEEGLVAS